MKKKFMHVLLASFLTVAVIGCSNSNNGNASGTKNEGASPTNERSESTAPGQIDFKEEPYTIKVNYAVLGQEQPDLPLIEEKLNEITLKEINAKVDLEGVSLFNMANVYALKASSGEKADLMLLMPGNSYLTAFANNRMIRPIDEELSTWGPALKETVGETLEVGKFKGKQYAIPQKAEQTVTNGFSFNKSILDKYNIDISKIKTIEDMDTIFATIHENEPNMTVLAPEVVSANITSNLVFTDDLGSAYGVLMDGNSTELTNLFESEQWINTAKKVREWYKKGYISKDVSTTQDDGNALLYGGKVFATAVTSVGFSGGFSLPIETRTVALHPPVIKTKDSQLFLWAVASSSERPDKAVQLLNLLNSSEELTNLLRYGIEGTHYEIEEGGLVDTAKNKNYDTNNWPAFGDINKMVLDKKFVDPTGFTPEEYTEKLKLWNENSVVSQAFGFIFDPTSVKTEVAALDAIIDQYVKVIGNGSVDTDELVKKLNDSLYSAGLQKVIDEKQSQLNA